MNNLNMRLSEHFTLGEFLHSETAERRPEWLAAQYSPSAEVIGNLAYLVTTTLEPVRSTFGFPIRITSGYRCKQVNDAVGSTDHSQHLRGQAADCKVDDRFLTHPAMAPLREKIAQRVHERTGRAIRSDVNANFYLYAYIALRLQHFDIDQLIHEYGPARGRPAWVHIAASPGAGNKGQTLCLGNGYGGVISLEQALLLGA